MCLSWNEKVVFGGKEKKELQGEGLWNTENIKGKEGGLGEEREGEHRAEKAKDG